MSEISLTLETQLGKQRHSELDYLDHGNESATRLLQKCMESLF